MRLPEQRLWDAMRRHLSARGVWLNRVENAVGVGDPDVEALVGGVVTKIELKAVAAADIPKRPGTPLLGERRGLSREQKNWLRGWTRRGGRAIVVVRAGTELLCLSGELADEINSSSLGELRAASWAGSWDELATVLKGQA